MATKNRVFRVKKATIKVSHSERNGYFFDFVIEAVFPGCRKVQRCAGPTPMARRVWITPLYGYNGYTHLSAEDFRRLVDVAVIVQDRFSSVPVPITSEVVEAARDYWRRVADCPAFNAETHPNFNPSHDAMEIDAVSVLSV